MSLTVHARRLASSSWETPTPPFNDLAGFEAWRSTVWGSDAVKRLGLRIIPSLEHTDIHASGDELVALEDEVNVLGRSLHDVVNELVANGVHIVSTTAWMVGVGWVERAVDPYETIHVRLANIAEAIRLARAIPNGKGEVVIW